MDIYSSLITTLLVSVLATPALAINQPTIKPSQPVFGVQQIKSSPRLAAPKEVSANVNINTADAKTLALELSGIGPKRAEAIIAYREQHVPFKSIDGLVEIKGIGKKTVERNREKIKI